MSRRRGRETWNIDLTGAIVRKTVLPKSVDSPEKKAKRKARRDARQAIRFAKLPDVAIRRNRYEVVILDWLPPTTNRLFRGNIRTRMRLEARSHEVVGHSCGAQGVSRALQRRMVSLRLGIPAWQYESDRDASYKALFDSLVGCGALTTDKIAGVEIGPVEFYLSTRLVTVLVLEDVPDLIPPMLLESGFPFARQ